jgi:hypothetical protein
MLFIKIKPRFIIKMLIVSRITFLIILSKRSNLKELIIKQKQKTADNF